MSPILFSISRSTAEGNRARFVPLFQRAIACVGLLCVSAASAHADDGGSGTDVTPAATVSSGTTVARPALPDGAKLPPIPDRLTPVRAQPYSVANPNDVPPPLETILSAPIVDLSSVDTSATQWEAIREGAIAYGMRAGFADGLFRHQLEFQHRSPELDSRYDFGRLVMPAPGGFLYEPGVVLGASDAVTHAADGQAAAKAAERLTILADPRLISRPRHWQDYLVFDVEPAAPVHPALLPRSGQEGRWKDWVRDGWKQGEAQADSTVELLFADMERDLRGMILWRTLLAEGKVSAPLITLADHGITADKQGRELRIGDVEVRVGDTSHLQRDPSRWKALPFITAAPAPLQVGAAPGTPK